jgi:hypothetical protein
LETAQDEAWRRLGSPGTWWTGAERLAIARECRAAVECPLCATRAGALSPFAVQGRHTIAEPSLPDAAIEAVHGMRNDSGRLGETWYSRLRAAGLSEEAFVELVSITAITVAIDTFRRGVGLSPLPLPAAEPGIPSRRRPLGAKPGTGWIATLAPEDRMDDDPNLYLAQKEGPPFRSGANIHRALSLVPHSMTHWWDVLEELYQHGPMMRDYDRDYRAISHPQIELLAARVAALNRCEY